MGEIIVDNGLEEYTIKNKQGKVLGTFYFNPADVEIVKRYECVANNIAHIADGISDDAPVEEVIRALEEKVNKEVDYLFNAEVSESFFSITSPFTPLANGEFFVENVLNAIGKLIEQTTGERFERIKTKVSKYTEKYKRV